MRDFDLGRRRFLQGAALTGAVSLLAACGGESQPRWKKGQNGARPFNGQGVARMGFATHHGDYIHNSGITDELRIMSAMAVGLNRTDTNYNVVKPTADSQSDYSRLDFIATESNKTGIIPVFILNLDSVPDGMGDINGMLTVSEYAQSAYELAKHAKEQGQKVIWELGNEFNVTMNGPQEYVPYATQGAKAIRRADKDALIVSGGITHFNDPVMWAAKLREAGALDDVNLFGYHPYNDANGPTGEVFDAVTEMSNKARMRVAYTEFGWSTFDGTNGVSPDQQAAYIAETFDGIRTGRFPVAFGTVYELVDSPDDSVPLRQHYGILTSDLQPKNGGLAVNDIRHQATLFKKAA
ncbi:MAG TPA: cellulase family glycosylhydrolase [Candidatus Saccharimonadales bacterium]|nr:cellulase family glycosylhydrolase [Candidatus Saccharimonadales bacterium]